LPNSLKEKCEEFDPCLMTMDVVEQHIPKLIISILEFRGDDQSFCTMLSERLDNFVIVLLIDLEDGFGNFDDVEIFVKANVIKGLEDASEPKNKKLTSMLGQGPIMNYISRCKSAKQPTQVVA
jgi:hypothetical protein